MGIWFYSKPELSNFRVSPGDQVKMEILIQNQSGLWDKAKILISTKLVANTDAPVPWTTF